MFFKCNSLLAIALFLFANVLFSMDHVLSPTEVDSPEVDHLDLNEDDIEEIRKIIEAEEKERDDQSLYLVKAIEENQKIYTNLDKHPLFPHQEKAIFEDLKNSLQEGKNDGYFFMATGTGKTRLFLYIIHLALKNPQFLGGKKVALLVPTLQLVQQTQEAINDYNTDMENYGFGIDTEQVEAVSSNNISAHFFNEKAAKIKKRQEKDQEKWLYIICNNSFRILQNKYSDIANNYFGLFIVDECHLETPKISQFLQEQSKNSFARVFGFTASPNGLTKESYSNCISTFSTIEAYKNEKLCPWVNVSLGKLENLPNLVETAHIWLKNLKHPITGLPVHEYKGIIFVGKAEDANNLESKLNLTEFKVKAHTYLKTKKERKKILKDFTTTKKINALISVNQFKVGYDQYDVFYVILLKPLSWEEFVQIRGRIVRRYPNKIAVVYACEETFMLDEPCPDYPKNYSAF